MTLSTRSSPSSDPREAGRLQVFDLIRAAGCIARIDIARETQLSPATVTVLTSQLLEGGLIEEITPDLSSQPPEARRGRPRVALRVRGAAYRVAGVKIAHNHISVLILDFEGHEIATHDMQLTEPRMPPKQLGEAVLKAVAETCELADVKPSDLSGIGLAIPGLVDARRNFIYWSSALTERNVDFGTVMADQAPCPVFLDNDANLVAKAEHLFGKARNESDFVVITVEHGVGMGIISGGKIYRGARGCGAEFGHTKVQLEGALCQCGQRGCLEAYVGDYALLREANIMDRDRPLNHITELVKNAESGDPLAQSIFERAGRMFALGLANVVNIFDPKLIILSGGRLSFDYLSADRVAEQMRNSVIQIDAPLPEIRIHAWGDEMWAKGAAAYAIEEVSALKVKELSKDAA